MLKSLQKAFKVKEVRDRLLYTFMMLVVIRIGCCLPIPGVDPSYLHDFFSNLQSSGMGFFNAITGGSFSSMSIFALSITPYITSSIIMQLLTIAIPKLEEMQKDGEDGRKKIAEYTRYLTVGLALFESCAMAVGLGGKGLLLEDHRNVWGYLTVVAAMTAGSALLMWIGERITSALERFENDSVVSVETLLETGVIKNPQDGVKILGNGELTKKLVVKANAFSEGAKAKIEAVGGTCEVI